MKHTPQSKRLYQLLCTYSTTVSGAGLCFIRAVLPPVIPATKSLNLHLISHCLWLITHIITSHTHRDLFQQFIIISTTRMSLISLAICIWYGLVCGTVRANCSKELRSSDVLTAYFSPTYKYMYVGLFRESLKLVNYLFLVRTFVSFATNLDYRKASLLIVLTIISFFY